jgi:branched-chain amino acid transport system permease protein
METNHQDTSGAWSGLKSRVAAFFQPVPLLGFFVAALAAAALERWLGLGLAHALGLPKIPVLFGILVILKEPVLIPGAVGYICLIYLLPVAVVSRLVAPLANSVARGMLQFPLVLSLLVHLAVLYAALHTWTEVSDYRDLTARLTMVAIILTLSLNLINGYMGEFSCSHPGFMSLGAYGASVVTLGLFVSDRMLGDAVLPGFLGPFMFPLALIFGGLVSSVGALVIAIPSFRTRGDYLAIISLAFMFIVKSLVENLEFLGGPRGLGDQPNWANLPTVFAVTAVAIWIINNFVTSIIGKGLNAVRDDETAAEAMTINTRRTKMTAFMFAAFWAGVAGGLYAHIMHYVNPANFGIQKLAEMLAMVYFGGLNSVYGSIVGAVSISLLGEMLRPLEIFKWIIIPLLLILVMIYRPKGLISFTEFNPRKLVQPKEPKS